ncbi:MAG: prepilin-type N-terminal cleavage/methylation domain-containing protein, partial [Candidatus Omnitrophica bacterium]|nr:prepilin-type N-terminal cleavage/methylation domain-containing protein [Candidatus Omnitrophota bacterium]
KGMSLLELIMVCAIILILSFSLIMTVMKARYHAKTVACANNLRQIGIAVQLYLDDFEHRFPPCESTVPSDCWYTELDYYIDDPESFKCPGYEFHSYDFTDASTRNFCSYGFNRSGLNESSAGYQLGKDINYVTSPTKCMIASEGSAGANPDNSVYYIDKNHLPIARHNNGVNVLFVDSHVRWMTRSSIPTSGSEAALWWNY